jgi:hypothetical protein
MAPSLPPFVTTPVPPGRILFPGNPWPNGHKIAKFRWTGRIEPTTGLIFDLHLESADYEAEDKQNDNEADEDESLPNWRSKGVWGNYHSCTLSSTLWDHMGFPASSADPPFDFDTLDGHEFTIDPLPVRDDEALAFGIYLQGHDTAADHRIRFRRMKGKNRWSVNWQGRIALTYRGDDRFVHQFKARVEKAAFEGIVLPPKTTKARAETLLARFVARPDQFTLEKADGELWFKLL